MTKSVRDRLALSRKVISAWEDMGGPSGVEGHLRMIADEVIILDDLGNKHPEFLEEVLELMERYCAMAERLKARAN